MFVAVVFFVGLSLYLSLASVGHRFLFHQIYTSRLLKLFDYGTKRIEKINEKLHQNRVRRRKISLIQEGVDQSQLKNYETSESETDSAFFDDYDAHDVPKTFKRNRTMSRKMFETKQELELSTIMDFANLGMQAIVDDEVTKRFAGEELKTWNLLTRTDKIYHYHSFRLAAIWVIGFIVRYFILFPIRIIITCAGVSWLITTTALIGLIPESRLKRFIYFYTSVMCFRVISRGFSAVITYHNPENKAKPGGICVANHTSPIDVVILHCSNAYALVGQRHGGILGILQRALARATHHIWFDRFEMSDRLGVSRRLREHAENKDKLPILIFPEGTCINNSAVMMFKKGSFEIDATIYPVAIKYDARFGDPFWNSSKYGYVRYFLMMMTSWAIVCDVWYLPPMQKEKGETAIEFANRVKAEIAHRGGLVDLGWDGQLKRQKVKPELIRKTQEKFSKTIEVHDGQNGDHSSDHSCGGEQHSGEHSSGHNSGHSSDHESNREAPGHEHNDDGHHSDHSGNQSSLVEGNEMSVQLENKDRKVDHKSEAANDVNHSENLNSPDPVDHKEIEDTVSPSDSKASNDRPVQGVDINSNPQPPPVAE